MCVCVCGGGGVGGGGGVEATQFKIDNVSTLTHT